MRFKKDEEGNLVLDDNGDPIAISESGEVIPLDKVVSLGKHQRVEGERDELKRQLGELQGQVEDLKKSAGDKDELEKKLTEISEGAEKAKADFEGRMASRDKEHALETALLKAGCRDTKAARAHVDMEAVSLDGETLKGFDAESFKKDRPYLFDATKKGAAGAPPKGTGDDDDEAQLRSVMGLAKEE